MRKGPRILFFGYSEVGYECLKLILDRGYNVVALVTHRDSPTENIWYERPATIAKKYDVPVFSPARVDTPDWIEVLCQLEPALILSVYYRNMLPMKLLDKAPLGAFNMHGSLLPKFRGRAPINWALIEGAKETGMTLHRMIAQADAGPIVDQMSVPIEDADTALTLYRKLVPLAKEILGRQIDRLLVGSATERDQNEGEATYFGGRTPEDGRIDWDQSSQRICNLVRAVTRPYPGAFSDLKEERLMVWKAIPRTEEFSDKIRPGRVVSLSPFVVSTADGEIELVDFEWTKLSHPNLAIPAPLLKLGQRIEKRPKKWFR